MKNTAIYGLCAICLTFAGILDAAAQTDDLLVVVRSGVCPDDLSPSDTVKYDVHCAGMDDKSCDINDKACFEAAKTCWDQVNLMNKQIFTYNNFMRKCAATKAAAAAAQPPVKKTLPTKPPTKKKQAQQPLQTQ